MDVPEGDLALSLPLIRFWLLMLVLLTPEAQYSHPTLPSNAILNSLELKIDDVRLDLTVVRGVQEAVLATVA